MSIEDMRISRVPSMSTGMLVHRPAPEVFQALVDPTITTKFWFTKSSGKLIAGDTVRWDWEMYGVSAEVVVKKVEEDRLIVADWGGGGHYTTFEVKFSPWGVDSTYVQVTETGYTGTADEVVAHAMDSTGGFTMMLCALKAYLEHGVILTVVADKAPPAGLDA